MANWLTADHRIRIALNNEWMSSDYYQKLYWIQPLHYNCTLFQTHPIKHQGIVKSMEWVEEEQTFSGHYIMQDTNLLCWFCQLTCLTDLVNNVIHLIIGNQYCFRYESVIVGTLCDLPTTFNWISCHCDWINYRYLEYLVSGCCFNSAGLCRYYWHANMNGRTSKEVI